MSSFLFDWAALQAATRGTWLVPPSASGGITAVNLSSKDTQPGELFLAYKGERHDGHSFLGDALDHGAAALLVHHEPPPELRARLQREQHPCLLVADTLRAYHDLARTHRQRFPHLPVIAVTGSSGKTSTKEILAVLARAACGADHVLQTEGNTNNLVGVPRNLLRLRPTDRAAVLELGTNAPGEIATLAATVLPTIAVLTSIGPVHLEGLGSVDGVAREKSALFAALGRDGLAILPHALADHPIVRATLPERILTVGPEPAAGVHIDYLGGDWTQSRFTYRRAGGPPTRVTWPLLGRHQAHNAGLGIAVGAILGLDDQAIAAALATVVLPGMRMKLSTVAGVRWFNDAYNANPASMAALLDWLAGLDAEAGTLHLCLGDMLELGPTADELHAQVLRHARTRLPQARLRPIGPHMGRAAAALGLPAWSTVEAARADLHASLQPGDLVVLKASRGMRLEGLL